MAVRPIVTYQQKVTVRIEITGLSQTFGTSITVPANTRGSETDTLTAALDDAAAAIRRAIGVEETTSACSLASDESSASDGGQSKPTVDEAEEIACAWADYRKDYGVPGPHMTTAHKAFKAGWKAAREGDQSGPVR